MTINEFAGLSHGVRDVMNSILGSIVNSVENKGGPTFFRSTSKLDLSHAKFGPNSFYFERLLSSTRF